MSLVEPTFFEQHKKLIKIGGIALAAIAALGLLLFLFDKAGEWGDQSKLKKAQEEVNAKQDEARNINSEIANLKQKEFEKQVEVNQAIANLEAAREETNEAQNTTNNALDNAAAVNGRDFNGTNAADANAARCRAFPDSPECRR